MSKVHTLLRYVILSSLILTGLFLVLSICKQDWMREEITVKYSSVKGMMKILGNSTSMIPGMASIAKDLDKIPPKAAFEFKSHFGLKQACNYLTFSGFGKPYQLIMPVLKLCVKNDVIANPQKYKFPDTTSTEMLSKQIDAMKHAFICMILAMVFVIVAMVTVILKAIRWPVPSLLASLISCVIAMICVIAALLLVNGEFNFKRDFDRAKAFAAYEGGDQGFPSNEYQSSRKRRDDGDAGYGDKYGDYKKTEEGDMTSGGNSFGTNMMQQMQTQLGTDFMAFLQDLELRESFGVPLPMCCVAIALLLLVIVLSVFEYRYIQKNGEADVKYQNVALT